MKDLFKNIKRGLKNIIKWFPIIWKDIDWDYLSLENILIFKLKNMANSINKGELEGCEETAREIFSVVELLESIQKDNYYDDIITLDKDLLKEWDFTEELTEDIEKLNFTDPRFSYYAIIQAEILKQKDLKLAMEIIAERMFYWWD